jgi:hypothetical protein
MINWTIIMARPNSSTILTLFEDLIPMLIINWKLEKLAEKQILTAKHIQMAV